MKQKNFLRVVLFILFSITTIFTIKSQTLSAGDIAIIGVGVDDEEILLVALVDIPANESVFFTDDEWAGSAFNSGEGFYEWVTPSITAGTVFTLTTTTTSVGGTVNSRAGSFALGNSGDGFFLYQTSTNVYNTGSYTIIGFAGEDSGDAGTLSGTGLTEGTNAVYFGGDNGVYSGVRTTNDKAGHLANIYNSANWTTSGTSQAPFDTTNFIMTGAGPGITLGAVSGNTSEDGTTATFTVVLNAQPTTDVVLDVSSGDTGEVTLDLSALTFTNANWDTPQTITATGIDDGIQDGSIVVTITVSVNDASSDDAYDPVADLTTNITNEDNELPNLVINEILADPNGTTGDANGDGTVDTINDEFVEIYNSTSNNLDISGYTLSDGVSDRHIFPNGTILPPNGTIVVFGGGTPNNFTNVGGLVQVASTGTLGLNNGGDTITIKNTSDVTVVTETYGAAGNDQSIARSPDFTGSFVDHSTIGTNTVDFSPGKDNTDNSPFIKTWTGSTNNVWATATNWLESDVPGASDHAIIRSGLSTYPTGSAGAISIGSLIIESGATLVTTNTFSGAVTYKRNLANGSQWYLMSSPVVGETYNDDWNSANSIDNGQGNNRGVSWYDNSVNDGTTGHWRYLQSTNSGTFNVSQGYGIRLSSGGDVSFIGTGIYTSNQDFTLTQGVNNFNLIGNPFTGFVTIGTFETTNGSEIEDEYYFWTGSAYVTRNNNNDSTFEIAPGQGFIVEATTGNAVTFEVSDVNHAAETFNTRTSNIRPEIHLSVLEGSKTIPVRILYTDGTTKGFDDGYDGKLFGGDSSSFIAYSDLIESNGIKYQTQVLPNKEHENMVIPIGIKASAGKEITFTAEALNIPNGLNVYLEDRLTGDVTRLDETDAAYKVTLSENSDGVGRFYLHTKTSSVLSTDDVFLNSVSIFSTNNNTLRIAGLQPGKASIKLYSILGKEVLNTSFTASTIYDVDLPNLSKGVYVVHLETTNGSINKKITLH